MISSLLPVVIHHETNADKSAEALENIYCLKFMWIGTNVKHKAPYEGWWDVWSEAMVSFPLVARTSEATRLLFTASILVRFGRHSRQLGNLTRHFFFNSLPPSAPAVHIFQDIWRLQFVLHAPLKTAAGKVPLGDREVTFWKEVSLGSCLSIPFYFYTCTLLQQLSKIIHFQCYLARHHRKTLAFSRIPSYHHDPCGNVTMYSVLWQLPKPNTCESQTDKDAKSGRRSRYINAIMRKQHVK